MIPYGRQNISDEDINSVVEVLKSDYLTQGPAVPLFEQKVAEYVGAEFAVAVNSATSALHIACMALNVGKGDLVWTSPNSFVASANCALYCDADVDFVDIEADTGNMCVKALTDKLEKAEQAGRLPKVVIPVHFAGQSCDMKNIHRLSLRFGFNIIEDASHAIGAKYLQAPVGNCRYADITVFSFHPVKIITSAEGGLATTNSKSLLAQLQLFRSHGVTRDPKLLTGENQEPWYYEQIDLGLNYRFTEIQAALGTSQLSRLDEFVVKRNELVAYYQQKLKPAVAQLNVKLLATSADCYSANHLFMIKVPAAKRRPLFEFLRNKKIGVNVHYIPIHHQPYYQTLGFTKDQYPKAVDHYNSAITLPLYPDLTEQDIDYIVACVEEGLTSV